MNEKKVVKKAIRKVKSSSLKDIYKGYYSTKKTRTVSRKEAGQRTFRRNLDV